MKIHLKIKVPKNYSGDLTLEIDLDSNSEVIAIEPLVETTTEETVAEEIVTEIEPEKGVDPDMARSY